MTSTSNLSTFKPTYLYIKQHALTGKLYFGKTVQDVLKYTGSGIIWTRHIEKYGIEHVVTLWHELFTDKDEMTNFALQFSKEMQIVESSSWLNLIDENGSGGIPFGVKGPMTGHKHSEETKAKISAASTGFRHSEETKAKISAANKGRKLSEEHKAKFVAGNKGKKNTEEYKTKMSELLKGRIFSIEHKEKLKGKKPTVICPHCGKSGGNNTMRRWHFDNCKQIKWMFHHKTF